MICGLGRRMHNELKSLIALETIFEPFAHFGTPVGDSRVVSMQVVFFWGGGGGLGYVKA